MTAVRPGPAASVALSRREAALLVTAACATGFLLVLVPWWQDPATRTVRSGGDVLVGVARAAGMLAAYLLLVQVALLARVPWLERRVGTDWLTGAHRWLGSYVMGLVAVHVGAVIVGYAAYDHASVSHETATLVLTYPYVLLGTVGLALVALVVVTSLKPLRRLLPYEVWHTLHLLAYVGIALAIVHQLVDGAQFARHATMRAGWIGAHVVVLLLVLRYRVGDPLLLWSRHRFRVVDVIPEADGSVSVYVGGRNLSRLPIEGGQYFRWRFLTPSGWWHAHPFSVSQAPNGRWLRMTAKPVGDHTSTLHRLREGVPVILEGPYGAVTRRLARGRHLVLVAGGSGIAPMLALAQEAARARTHVTLIYRVSGRGQAWFQTELDRLAQTGHVDLHVLAGGRHEEEVRRFLRAGQLTRLLTEPGEVDAYLCGPEGLVSEMITLLQAAGVAAPRIHTESFAW